ncbi:AAA family ATPase [Acinetobacter pittii]|uniref:AAA family ATPase n=1 Tax=Acinetobacter pittii TaxID=48296 RepID=UPI0032610607
MEPYILHAFRAENFRQFSKITVLFDKKFNFLTGPNGCGKSSILEGIYHSLHHDWRSSRLNEDSSFSTEIHINNKVIFSGLGKDSFQSNSTYRSNNMKSWIKPEIISPSVLEGKEYISIVPDGSARTIVPLFLGTKRSIDYKKIDGARRESSSTEYISTYKQKSIQSQNSDVKQWFINRYFFIDKEWATYERANWQKLIDNLPQIAPFDSDFKYVKTGRDLEPIFSLYGQECYLEELSSGFQAIFSIIANIIEWIEKINEGDLRDIHQATGTVLIDELDLHLHPEWQFNIRDGLVAIFPKLQFIVTTHSPHMLSSAKEGEVIIMSRLNGKTEYEFAPTNKRYSGWNTDQILEDVMGVKSLKNKEYEQLIEDSLVAYENKDKIKLNELLTKLKSVAHTNDVILQVLEIRLASLELNND